MAETYFTDEERGIFREKFRSLARLSHDIGEPGDLRAVIRSIRSSINEGFYKRDRYGINPLIHIPRREEGYEPSDLAFSEFEHTSSPSSSLLCAGDIFLGFIS